MPGFDHADSSSQPSGEHARRRDPSTDSGSASEKTGDRQLALAKHGHRYVFDYTLGQETELLKRLVHLAHDPGCALEMFDAAVLSHQVGMSLSQQVGEMLRH